MLATPNDADIALSKSARTFTAKPSDDNTWTLQVMSSVLHKFHGGRICRGGWIDGLLSFNVKESVKGSMTNSTPVQQFAFLDNVTRSHSVNTQSIGFQSRPLRRESWS